MRLNLRCIKTQPDICPIFYRSRVPICLILVFIAACSCRSSEKKQKDQKDLDSLAAVALGAANKIELNTSGEFALCQQQPAGDHARRKFKYIVIRVSDNSIVREGYFTSGYAKWHDAESIEVFSSPGPGKNETGSKKIINVNSPQ